ncbi:hypothetical protein [Bacillus sp. EB01]|uniref:hypothetical protein n=1 Tax=Bacillus sp. EB01 TaxID=1347086 RepID=UPI000693A36D|nr:hypothetical protein [Bacillus sp. EB01]
MGIVGSSMFSTYKERILSLQAPLIQENLRGPEFLLDGDEARKLEIYYTPFDYINSEAKILIAGITPGMHQMQIAFQTVWELGNERWKDEAILHEVKKRASFEGPMRRNLVAMLDELGLADWLGMNTSMELFGDANHLVHTASVLPHAVFFNGKNYNGSRPDIWKTDLLQRHVCTYFAKDHSVLRSPLIIPLGVNFQKVLVELGKKGFLDTEHLLHGFPHPSGSNGHRHRQFAEHRDQMKSKIGRFFN